MMIPPVDSPDEPISRRTRLVCRTVGLLMVVWFCFGLVARLVAREFYPSLSMPAFVRPKAFDFENLKSVDHVVEYYVADSKVASLTPRELLKVFDIGATTGTFNRQFPMSEGIQRCSADPEVWDWMCTVAEVDAAQIDEIHIIELWQGHRGAANQDARPSGRGLHYTPPVRPRNLQ